MNAAEFYGRLKSLFKRLVITIWVCETQRMQLWDCETAANWPWKLLYAKKQPTNKTDSHKMADGRKSLKIVPRSLIEKKGEENGNRANGMFTVLNVLQSANAIRISNRMYSMKSVWKFDFAWAENVRHSKQFCRTRSVSLYWSISQE